MRRIGVVIRQAETVKQDVELLAERGVLPIRQRPVLVGERAELATDALAHEGKESLPAVGVPEPSQIAPRLGVGISIRYLGDDLQRVGAGEHGAETSPHQLQHRPSPG